LRQRWVLRLVASLRERRDEIDLASVAEDVRIRVRGHRELALLDELADLCPRASLLVKEADPPAPEVVGREGGDAGGAAGAGKRGALLLLGRPEH
jgi:hypothetical protein